MLDEEDHQKLRGLVAVGHVGLGFIVEGREDLAGRRLVFGDFGNLVELRGGHSEVSVRILFQTRLAKFGSEEAGQ